MADSISIRTKYDAAMKPTVLAVFLLAACNDHAPGDGVGDDVDGAHEGTDAGNDTDSAEEAGPDARHDDPDGSFSAAGGWTITFETDCGTVTVSWWMNWGGVDSWWESNVDVTDPDGFRPAVDANDLDGCRLSFLPPESAYDIECGRWDGSDPRFFVEVSDDGTTATAHVRRWGHSGCRADDVDATVTNRER